MQLHSFTGFWRLGLSIMVIGVFVDAIPGFAIEIPGAADVGRIKPPENIPEPPPVAPESIPPALPEFPVPAHAEQIHLILEDINIHGVTAFDLAVFKSFYEDLLDKDITLDKLWAVAAKITDYYRAHGFFLSRAFIPMQTIDHGVITIQMVEGYIGTVDIPEDLRDIRIVRDSVDRITSERPLSLLTLESVLLRLNDLPGVALRSVLEPLEGMDGAAKLTLVREEKRPEATAQLDNYGTRYAGPSQATGFFHGALIPMQDTTLSTFTPFPTSELRYGSLEQRIPLNFKTDLILQINRSKSAPGYTLTSDDIRGDSKDVAIGLNYSIMRQRQENLQIHTLLEGRNSDTDILNTKLTRDRIRAFRAGVRYDHADSWNGINSYDITISRGLSTLGATGNNNPDVSRHGAKPDFTKEEITFSRWQDVGHDVNMLFSAMGQRAPNVLYSSEEIGFGGQTYGRAYDPSELTGNQGIMAMAELRYDGVPLMHGVHSEPYVFYDIGEVWSGQEGDYKTVSAASTGMGIRLTTEWHISADFAVAKPLTRPQSAPISGIGNSPRYLAKIVVSY